MFNIFTRNKEEGILSLLKDIKTSLIDIDVVYQDPEQVNYLQLLTQLSTEAYAQVAPGVYDRVVKDITDVKYAKEKPYADLLKKLDFKKNHVVFVVFTKHANFPPHYHGTEEVIHCLEGSYIGGENEVFIPGETQVIPANKVHTFIGVEDGMCLLTLAK